MKWIVETSSKIHYDHLELEPMILVLNRRHYTSLVATSSVLFINKNAKNFVNLFQDFLIDTDLYEWKTNVKFILFYFKL